MKILHIIEYLVLKRAVLLGSIKIEETKIVTVESCVVFVPAISLKMDSRGSGIGKEAGLPNMF